jgi:hypothetical protein
VQSEILRIGREPRDEGERGGAGATIEARVDAYGDEDVTKNEAGMRTIPPSR